MKTLREYIDLIDRVQSVAEGFLGDKEFNRVMPFVKRIAGEVTDYDRDEFGEELWSLLDQKYGSKFAQSVLADLDVYWHEYLEMTNQGVAEGSSSNLKQLIQQYEDMVENVYGMVPGARQRKAIEQRDALEARIEALPGGKEALSKWARSYNDSFDEGVAEEQLEETTPDAVRRVEELFQDK